MDNFQGNTFKTKNQLILEAVKAGEEFQTSYERLKSIREECLKRGIKNFDILFLKHIEDKRPAPFTYFPEQTQTYTEKREISKADSVNLGLASYVPDATP